MMRWTAIDSKYRNLLERQAEKSAEELLELSTSYSREQLRASYRRLMKLYHPDRSHRFLLRYNQEMTKLLTTAYSQLVRKIDG